MESMVKALLLLLLPALADFSSYARDLASLPVEHLHDATVLTSSDFDLRDAAPLGGQRYVMVAGGVQAWEERSVTAAAAGADQSGRATLPAEEGGPCATSEHLVASEDCWWYSRCGHTPTETRVELITSTSSHPVMVTVPVPPRRALGWSPMQGCEPAGVLLTGYGSAVTAYLVTTGSAQELASFNMFGPVFPGYWTAVRLADRRIAVVAIEQDDRHVDSRIMFRILGADGEVTETSLAFDPRQQYANVAAAVGTNGQVAVIAVTADSSVSGMTFSPDNPAAGRPRTLSTGEGAALPFPGAVVEPLEDRFAVSWIGVSDRAVWLSELAPAFALPPVRVGDESDRAHPLLFLHRRDDGLDVMWVGARGLTVRSLPAQPTGYLVAADFWPRVRASVERRFKQ